MQGTVCNVLVLDAFKKVTASFITATLNVMMKLAVAFFLVTRAAYSLVSFMVIYVTITYYSLITSIPSL